MCIVAEVGRVDLERLVVRPVAVVAIDIICRCQAKHPGPAAAPAGHATADPDRMGQPWHRSVISIRSGILEHALTIKWRRGWVAERRPDLVTRKVPSETEPPHDLAKHPTVEWVKDRSAHVLKKTARIAVLIPVSPAE
jgi:hypothetical protein